jgi:exodeoxyribonuclease V alpha subunit
LILDAAGRLYMHRYWRYEQQLAASLRARAGALHAEIDPAMLRPTLQTLFPGEHDAPQRTAAAIAMLKDLCILSGGPGTGKTTTIVRLLAMLAQWYSKLPLRMALAAPTGKAAARMQQAVRQARSQLPLDAATLAMIPEDAQTLHRLLGARPDSTRFAHDRSRPLPLDVLVIDEASMVDLALMSRVLDALPPDARLILVGDRDQLASVEPGAVLGSVCADRNACTPAFAALLRVATGHRLEEAGENASPLRDACVLLTRSHRFGAEGAIARLARAIRDGQEKDALSALRAGPEIEWHDGPPQGTVLRAALDEPLRRYARAVAQGEPESAFAAFESFRVLSAVRDGPLGTQWLNEYIERELRRVLRGAGLVQAGGEWFAGKAVMINRNHRALRLFNGDIALVLPSADGLRAWLRGPAGGLRELSTARLPSHEPAYAMTVHKSQGSEFDEVMVLLPRADSPALTRELLYTALTRARSRIRLWGSEQVLRAAIARPTTRGSGLRDACWAGRGDGDADAVISS